MNQIWVKVQMYPMLILLDKHIYLVIHVLVLKVQVKAVIIQIWTIAISVV